MEDTTFAPEEQCVPELEDYIHALESGSSALVNEASVAIVAVRQLTNESNESDLHSGTFAHMLLSGVGQRLEELRAAYDGIQRELRRCDCVHDDSKST